MIWRARSSSMTSCTMSSTSRRSSVSTISWARRRRKTYWRSVSRMGCSNPSGSVTSSTTCRSTFRRHSGSTFVRVSTNPPAPTRTWWLRTCCRSWRSWRWSRRRALEGHARSARRRTRSSVRCSRCTRVMWCEVSTSATATKGRRERFRRRDVHRAQDLFGQLAVGRRAVLPAHRQTDGGRTTDHLDRVQGGAADDVPGRFRVGSQGPDHLTFDLADASRVSLSFYGKRPGPGMRLEKLSMQFSTQETESAGDVLEAYERLILDAMRGDHTLFTTATVHFEQIRSRTSTTTPYCRGGSLASSGDLLLGLGHVCPGTPAMGGDQARSDRYRSRGPVPMVQAHRTVTGMFRAAKMPRYRTPTVPRGSGGFGCSGPAVRLPRSWLLPGPAVGRCRSGCRSRSPGGAGGSGGCRTGRGRGTRVRHGWRRAAMADQRIGRDGLAGQFGLGHGHPADLGEGGR